MSTTTIENRKHYEALLGALEAGQVDDATFEAMVAFAKAKKIKRPVRPEGAGNGAPENKKLTAREQREAEDEAVKRARKAADDAVLGKKPSTRAKNKGEECLEDGCDRGAVAKGRCSKHHTAWWRAQDPERMERAREASRRYAAKKREEKKAAAK